MRTVGTVPEPHDEPGGAAALNRTERKKREKLSAIKRAARELFARRGFKATRTRDIAERADVGAGTLFLYTASKQELLVEIFLEEIGGTLDAAFASMPAGVPLLDQLLHIFNRAIRYHEPDPELARVFVKELAFVEKRLSERTEAFLRDWYARMAAIIEDAQARGKFPRDVPALALARNCFALYIFTLKTWLGGTHSRAECESRLRESLGLHLRCALPPRQRMSARERRKDRTRGRAATSTSPSIDTTSHSANEDPGDERADRRTRGMAAHPA